jgi:hypothetical protein
MDEEEETGIGVGVKLPVKGLDEQEEEVWADVFELVVSVESLLSVLD